MRRLVVLGAVLALVGCGKKEEAKALPEVTAPPPVTKPAPPGPSNWAIIHKGERTWLAVNGRIDTVKDMKRIWFGTVSVDPSKPAISDSLIEFDCVNRSQRTLQNTAYDSKGDGIEHNAEKDPSWSYPAPNTVAEKVMGIACGETQTITGHGVYDDLKAARAALYNSVQLGKK